MDSVLSILRLEVEHTHTRTHICNVCVCVRAYLRGGCVVGAWVRGCVCIM